jgi:hypothetical protein
MKPRRYETPAAFKRALEDRLKAGSKTGGDGVQYDGLRYRAACRLAEKVYGQRFGIDVAFGDPPAIPRRGASEDP